MINRETRDRALNILENGTQAQYQNEAVKEYLEAKTIAIDSIKKLDKIDQIVKDYDGTIPSMIKQFSEIQKVLEKE